MNGIRIPGVRFDPSLKETIHPSITCGACRTNQVNEAATAAASIALPLLLCSSMTCKPRGRYGSGNPLSWPWPSLTAVIAAAKEPLLKL